MILNNNTKIKLLKTLSFTFLILLSLLLVKCSQTNNPKEPQEPDKFTVREDGSYLPEEEIAKRKEEATEFYSNPKKELMEDSDAQFIIGEVQELANSFKFTDLEAKISEKSKNFNSAESPAFNKILKPIQDDAVLLANIEDFSPTESLEDLKNCKDLFKDLQSREMLFYGYLSLPMSKRAYLAQDQDSVVPDIKAPISSDPTNQIFSFLNNGEIVRFKIAIDYDKKELIGIYPESDKDKDKFIKVKDYLDFYYRNQDQEEVM